jgi:hypothetical protein
MLAFMKEGSRNKNLLPEQPRCDTSLPHLKRKEFQLLQLTLQLRFWKGELSWMTSTMGSGAVRKPVFALAFIKAGIAESENLPLQ